MKRFENKERIILRDYLALQRTSLANERTLFSYIRTSLYLLVAGIGLVKLKDFESLTWLGYVAFGGSVVVLVYGFIHFWVLRKHLHKYYEQMDVPEE
ncbi:MAG: hypothetical protein CL843_01170 [Crocinitomicaceae bacterium]|nr:hypothetical protein [Crocinitomicaceae bacterium]|tara:strand:- start:342 stop:632 length:291 start_codon:yes stop_codon:yes gene_type:complete